MSGNVVHGLGIVLATLMMAAAASTPAMAEGQGDCDLVSGWCSVTDVRPSSSKPGKDDSRSTSDEDVREVELAQCTDFDEAYMDRPDDVDNPEDWVQVNCLEGHLPLVVWVEGRASPAQTARSLLARVQLQPIEIGLVPKGPDAVGLVGLPVWLWVEDPSRTTWGPATISAGGVTLTAEVQSVTWDMGDGTTVKCGPGTAWRSGTDGAPSPTCGHTYSKQGRYAIRASSHWMARWSGYGQSGTIPVTLSTSMRLDVGEIQVIVTGG